MSSRPSDTPSFSAHRRLATAGFALLAAVAIAVAGLAVRSAARQPPESELPRLADLLQKTIDGAGVEAAVAQYRTLLEQGFPGVRESEAGINSLGYARLGAGDVAGAIRIFELNVETHPGSANVHDSLAEAQLAAGDTAAAIASYRRAVEIDPKMKSAGAALARLTGYRRPPLRPMVYFHIAGGAIGILSGFVAGALKKGTRRHAMAGRVFTISMLSMSTSAIYIALSDPEGAVINVLMGTLTFYLVATSWWTARQRTGEAGLFDAGAWLVGLAAAAGLLYFGVEAAVSASGARDGIPARIYLIFGSVALLAVVGDLLRIRRGNLAGAPRLARHLWRMAAALFIAVTSFFLGQPQVFPVALRESGLLGLPPLLVVLFLVFWLARVRFAKRYGWRRAKEREREREKREEPMPAHTVAG